MKIKNTSEQDVQVITTNHKPKRFNIIAIGTLLIATLIWQVAPSANRWSQAEKSSTHSSCNGNKNDLAIGDKV